MAKKQKKTVTDIALVFSGILGIVAFAAALIYGWSLVNKLYPRIAPDNSVVQQGPARSDTSKGGLSRTYVARGRGYYNAGVTNPDGHTCKQVLRNNDLLKPHDAYRIGLGSDKAGDFILLGYESKADPIFNPHATVSTDRVHIYVDGIASTLTPAASESEYERYDDGTNITYDYAAVRLDHSNMAAILTSEQNAGLTHLKHRSKCEITFTPSGKGV
jgi:hypothetical protein